ncbi:MAG: alpha/beta hydrolase [Spirochaetaceae bacterium]|nr:alpha/beta hydrolase [Spirochaetaceae bacterium]
MGLRISRQAVKKLKALNFSHKVPVKVYRQRIEDTFTVKTLPNKVDYKDIVVNGVQCGLLKPELIAEKRVILYIHGGCYAAGSRHSWRNFCASISNEGASKLVIPEYRLAPEHPFPCAIDDIEQVYNHLAEKNCRVILAGDSSGCAIALALIRRLMDNFQNLPAAAAFLSPWIRPDRSAFHSVEKKSGDPIITSEGLMAAAELYTFSKNMGNPLVSPLEGSLAGFPPLFVQCGGSELLLSDAKALSDKAGQADIPCELDVWEDMCHLFQMADEYVSEAHLAIHKLGAFMRNF